MNDLFERSSAAGKMPTAMIGKKQEPQCMVSPTWFGWESLRLEAPVEPAPVAPQGEEGLNKEYKSG